jgi:SPP1 gp7 family putative phage head morphogenesis protein
MSKKTSEPKYIKSLTQNYAKLILSETSQAQKLIEKWIIKKLDEIRGNTRLDAKDTVLTRLLDFMAGAMSVFFQELMISGQDPRGINYSKLLKKSIVNGVIKSLHNAQFKAFSREHKKLLGVDPIKNVAGMSDLLDMMTSDNVNLIKSIHADLFESVEVIVRDGFRGGDRNATITKAIKERFGVTRNKAKLLARDQISKMNGQLERLTAKENGVKKYIWHTNFDGRERPDHAKLDGEVFSWDKPPITVTTGKRSGERNHPGEDIQCRCWAENVYED